MNFLVTGMGRSGTKWLATVANKSPTWTVEHEPELAGKQPKWCPQQSASGIAQLFAQRKNEGKGDYGAVSSHWRFQARAILVDKLAVLIRDPRDILVSMCNRRKVDPQHHIRELDDALRAMDAMLAGMGARDVVQLHLDHIASHPRTLHEALKKLGINDYRPTEEDLLPVNATPADKKHYADFASLPSDAQEMAQKFEWFREMYL